MTTPHTGWLYVVDVDGGVCEIFNHERTLAALRGTQACGSFQVLDDDCVWTNGMLPFAMDPCDEWAPQTFDVPTWPGNPAPWWDGVADSPSAGGYGFWIEEWTGLDSAHLSRSTAVRAGRRGGSNFGSLTGAHRTWKMNVVLVGASAPALEEMFRWLESSLIDACNPCAGSEALIRTVCPPDGAPEFGVYKVKGLALLEGLSWEEPPIERLACFMRRVSFTLGVSDPCLYTCSDSCMEDEQFPFISGCIPFALWAGCNPDCTALEDYRLCCPVPASLRGTTAPIVTILNDGPDEAPPVRIYGMADPLGIGCDPCSLPVCQDIRTTAIPAGAELMVDSAARKVLYRSSATNGDWVDGTPFLDPEPGTSPTFLQLSCDQGWVAIEPVAFCGDTNNLKFSVDIVSRVGCA